MLPSNLPVTGVQPLPDIQVEPANPPNPPAPLSFETGAVGDSHVRFRALAVAVPWPPGGALVVAQSLQPMNQTLSHLVTIEAVVTGVVLALLIVLVYWVVRRGLRPLEDMAATAGEIAQGDLSRRVSPATPETEVGRLGEALNSMLGQIEAAFAERTASEERLRRFVGDASHELRTPLTSIRGYAELFRRGAARDPEGLDRAMGRIESEATRMGALVDDLLLLARLDQGRPLESKPVDLGDLAQEAVGDARVVDSRRPITLDDSGQVIVAGDEDRLRQVAGNLLSNAVSHTAPGTPVHVRVAEGGGVAVLEVSDEGRGLEPDEAARVFERFYRTDSARTRGGSGLGLSIVSAIAKAHGGRASVESVPGHGATFRVELPPFEGAQGRNGRRDGATDARAVRSGRP